MDPDLREQAQKRAAAKTATARRLLCFGAIVLGVIIATLSSPAMAQVNCEAMPPGPSRTDCYIGRARISQGNSAIAADAAKQSRDAARLNALTGGVQAGKGRRSRPRVPVN